MADFWATVAHHFVSGGSRSDVLRPLVWPTGLLLFALVAGAAKGVPAWLLAFLAVFAAIFLLLYLGAYISFGRRDPNLLRSERFNIERMQIEHGLYGDSLRGISEVSPQTVQLPGTTGDTPAGDTQ